MNKATFLNKLKNNPKPVLVDLWAPWCAPCKMMDPILKSVEKDYHNSVDVWKINTDQNQTLLKELGVMGIPTMIGYYQGEELFRRTGAQSPENVKNLFEALLSGEKPQKTLSAIDRLLRAGSGLAIIAIGWSNSQQPLLLIIGAILILSAFFGRRPFYQTISALFKRPT